MPVAVAVLLFCAGAALLAWWVWLRLGRTGSARSWARGSGEDVRRSMFLIPAVGAALVAVSLAAPAERGSQPAGAVAGVCLVVFLVLSTWGGLGLPIPRWYLPRWARDEYTRMRASEKSQRTRRTERR